MIALLKVIFALAATVFVGDILLELVWKLNAERSGEPRALLFANQTIVRTDNLLLGPSAMLTAISGNLLAPRLGLNIYATPSLSLAMAAFILSGVVWGLFLIPLQKAQVKACQEAGEHGVLPQRYAGLAARWKFWGLLAAALVVAALLLVALY